MIIHENYGNKLKITMFQYTIFSQKLSITGCAISIQVYDLYSLCLIQLEPKQLTSVPGERKKAVF